MIPYKANLRNTRWLIISVLFLLPLIAWNIYSQNYRSDPLVWHGLMLATLIIFVLRISYSAWHANDRLLCLCSLCSWIVLIFVIYELRMELLPSNFRSWWIVSCWFVTVSLAVCALVAHRYLKTREQLFELSQSHQSQIEAATQDERQRLIRNIHDSVGTQLIALLALLNNHASTAEIKNHTEEALSELRMAVDTVSNTNGNLSLLLACLRHRLQARLDAAKLHLVWRVDAIPISTKISTSDIQHIQRIVFEAISNIMQHAHATQVIISAGYDIDEKRYLISICDDGEGFAPSATNGQGIANMQYRADILHATLSIDRGEPRGTSVSLSIPIHS